MFPKLLCIEEIVSQTLYDSEIITGRKSLGGCYRNRSLYTFWCTPMYVYTPLYTRTDGCHECVLLSGSIRTELLVGLSLVKDRIEVWGSYCLQVEVKS